MAALFSQLFLHLQLRFCNDIFSAARARRRGGLTGVSAGCDLGWKYALMKCPGGPNLGELLS